MGSLKGCCPAAVQSVFIIEHPQPRAVLRAFLLPSYRKLLIEFETRDLENLREHYGLTLREWVRRQEEHADKARRYTNDSAYRIWRLYMAGSAHRFLAGRLNSYHTLLLKGIPEDGLPLTRHGWYRD